MNPIQDPGLNSVDTRVTEEDLEGAADGVREATEALVWIWAEATGGLQMSASLESLSALLQGHGGGCGVELSMDGASLMVQVRGGGALLMSVALGMELRGGDYLKTQGAEPTSLGECM